MFKTTNNEQISEFYENLEDIVDNISEFSREVSQLKINEKELSSTK